MVMHWFNAVCWGVLLITGIGLVDNPVLQPLGMWWVHVTQDLFGGGAQLLQVHIVCGAIWSIGFLLYGVIFLRSTLAFVREILTVSLRRDLLWLIKKPLSMTVGPKIMGRFGMRPKIPDQGFYNVGQKLFAIPALFGGMLIAVTGWIMTFSKQDLTGVDMVQWSILIHFITVGLVFAGLLIHIYMAAVAKGELPALISMFTGKVPADYAEHHHRFWYEEVTSQEPESDSSLR
jgi:formate dehydrogenase subunit gamma